MHQRRTERRALCDGLLAESLDILDRLQFYLEMLDEMAGTNNDIPEIGLSRDDMQIFISNTGKLGLLLYGAAPYVVQFYSRVRRLVAGGPSRDLLGLGIKPSGAVGQKQKDVSDAITAGHAVVNSLSRQTSKYGGSEADVWLFRKRAEERRSKHIAS